MNDEESTPSSQAPSEDDEQLLPWLLARENARTTGATPQEAHAAVPPADLRSRLEGVLACIDVLRQVLPQRGATAAPDLPFRRLGRFEIHRELGRGAFGIVFLASDPQLGREVALKVPRPEVLVTAELRERFIREARAAAGLDHPNLVPVYEAGEVGPICYIASAYCPGIALNSWLKEHTESVPLLQAAWLVAIIAEAVQHAHERGVVHRDLKPSNVLLQRRSQEDTIDPAASPRALAVPFHFIPRVTDFGLAKVNADAPGKAATEEGALTRSGAVVGTPNYMAPEQASGKSKEIGPAADVYALGVILYELLTGRPPFRGETILDTLDQMRTREPLPPSRLRPKLPRDLETICLKCLRKEPHKRYASAAALADDLRRYLAGEPIQARPIRVWERGLKWARRKPAVAVLWAVGLVAVLVGTGRALWLHWEQAERWRAAELVLTEVELRQEAGPDLATWNGRYAAAQRAATLVERVSGAEDLKKRLRHLLEKLDAEDRDRRMLARLDEIRLLKAADAKGGGFDFARADLEYAKAFREYGIDVEGLEPEDAAALIQERPVRQQLAAALDDWGSVLRRVGKEAASRQRLEVARRADPDAWRNRLRDAQESRDRPALLNLADEGERALAAQAVDAELPPPTLLLLGNALTAVGETTRAVQWLQQARRRHPGDFWINHDLGVALGTKKPAEPGEAVRYLTAAVALYPDSAVNHNNLGYALKDKGRLDEAIDEFREAIRIQKDYPKARCNLGDALKDKGRLDEAITEYREAIRIKKDYADAHNDLGIALSSKGRLDEAIAEFREVIRLNKDDAEARNNLGINLARQGHLDEAIDEFREALRLNRDYADAHFNLGRALSSKGRLDEAIAEFREIIRLSKDDAEAHSKLKEALAVRDTLAKLPAILSGRAKADDPAEQLVLARVCQAPYKRLYAAAAQFYLDAFAAQPRLADDLNARHRCNAACAASLAGCGQGEDAAKLSTKERARLRQQALDWLRADLKVYCQLLEKSAGKADPAIAQRMQHWLQDPDLAGLREEAALAGLSSVERGAYRQLWVDVKALLSRASN